MYLVYWDDILVGMASVLPFPSGTLKYAFRQHRLVILPDFQGLGIGTTVNNFLGDHYINNGYKYFIRTTHTRMRRHMESNRSWRPTSKNGTLRSKKVISDALNKCLTGDRRIAASFEYMGNDYATKPKKIIKVDKVSDIYKFKNYINDLKKNYYIIVATGTPIEDNEIELAMMELGIRTEQLYYRKNGELVENGKYALCEYFKFHL